MTSKTASGGHTVLASTPIVGNPGLVVAYPLHLPAGRSWDWLEADDTLRQQCV